MFKENLDAACSLNVTYELKQLGVEHLSIVKPSAVRLVGSTYICGKGEDIDVLLRVKDAVDAAEILEQAGFKVDGEESYLANGGFISLKKDGINALVCEHQQVYEDWVKAAEVCKAVYKKQGSIDKVTRRAIHQVIMDGYSAEEV